MLPSRCGIYHRGAGAARALKNRRTRETRERIGCVQRAEHNTRGEAGAVIDHMNPSVGVHCTDHEYSTFV